ncbi:MAG: hypothetical protein R3C56_39410 [Pirellulaceae bacterium]
MKQVCEQFAEAHGQGLIHRDIKPANIFSGRAAEWADVAKLLDFRSGSTNRADTSPDGQDDDLTRDGSITVRRCTCHLSRRRSRTNAAISIHWAEWPTI